MKEKGLSEVEKRKNKIQQQIDRLDAIAKGGVNNREMQKLRRMGLDTTGVKTLERSQFVGDEIALLREQLANMNKQHERTNHSEAELPNMNTVTDASVVNNNTTQTTVMHFSHENKDRPNGTGMLAYE